MLCSDNCLVRELLELRQEPSKERGDRFRVLSEYYNSMDGQTAQRDFEEGLSIILRNLRDQVLFLLFLDFIAYCVREETPFSRSIEDLKRRLIDQLMNQWRLTDKNSVCLSVLLSEQSRVHEVSKVPYRCLSALYNTDEDGLIWFRVLQNVVQQVIARQDKNKIVQYNSENQLYKENLLMKFKAIIVQLSEPPSLRTLEVWLSAVRAIVQLFTRLHGSKCFQTDLKKQLTSAFLLNASRNICDNIQISRHIYSLLREMMMCFPLYENAEIMKYLTSILHKERLKQPCLVRLVETLLLQLEKGNVLRQHSDSVAYLLGVEFLDALVPKLLAALVNSEVKDDGNEAVQTSRIDQLKVKEEYANLVVLSHRVYPKKYMQALTKVVMGNWGGLQDNSLLVALTCLYEESLIDSQIGTIRLVQLLQEQIDSYVQLIRSEQPRYFLENPHLLALADFIFALKITCRFGIKLLMAHNRLPSLFGNLFRLAIKGVLAPFIGEFLITVIEEASHTSIFFKDFDKKILRLLKELHAEEENLKLLTHSLNELTPTLLVMCSAFAESLNNSYLTCSEQMLTLINKLRLSNLLDESTLTNICKLLHVFYRRNLTGLSCSQVKKLREQVQILFTNLVISGASQLLELYVEIMMRSTCHLQMKDLFVKQHEAVETTFSASRFESIRYLYDISMYIYREGAFDLHLLVESHRKIAEELQYGKRLPMVANFVEFLRYQGARFYAQYQRDPNVNSYNGFCLDEMLQTEKHILKLANLREATKNTDYEGQFITIRTSCLHYLSELSSYFRKSAIPPGSLKQRSQDIFVKIYSIFKGISQDNGTGKDLQYFLKSHKKDDQIFCCVALASMINRQFLLLGKEKRKELQIEIYIKLQQIGNVNKAQAVGDEHDEQIQMTCGTRLDLSRAKQIVYGYFLEADREQILAR